MELTDGTDQSIHRKRPPSNDDSDLSVLHVTPTFPPVRGGAPYFVRNLARELTDRQVQVSVVSTKTGGPPPPTNYQVIRSPAVKVGGFPAAPSFPKTILEEVRRSEPDIIHANYPLPLYPEVSSAASKICDIPLVLTCHGALAMNFQSIVGAFASVYNRTLLKVSLHHAARVHVSNSGIRTEIPIFSKFTDKVDVIPMGVDVEWFDPSKVETPPPFEIQDDRPVILYAGAFRRYKGLPILIEAVELMQPEVHLVLIGEGPERDTVNSAIETKGIADQVTLPGHVSDEALRSAYRHADVFVLPSPTFEESLGLVALEAMAMGLPVVVTEHSGVGRIFSDESEGHVVEAGNAESIATGVSEILDSDYASQDRRQARRRFIESNFAWSSLASEYIKLYRDVLSR